MRSLTAALLIGVMLLARCSNPPITAPIPFTTIVEAHAIPLDATAATPFVTDLVVMSITSSAQQAAFLATLPDDLAASVPPTDYRHQFLITIVYGARWDALTPTIQDVSAKGLHIYVTTDWTPANHADAGRHAALTLIQLDRIVGPADALTIHLIDAASGAEQPSRRYVMP